MDSDFVATAGQNLYSSCAPKLGATATQSRLTSILPSPQNLPSQILRLQLTVERRQMAPSKNTPVASTQQPIEPPEQH